MKPREAYRCAMAALGSGEPVTIVLADGRTVRGIVCDVVSNIEPMGTPGEMIPGPMSIHLSVELIP